MMRSLLGKLNSFFGKGTPSTRVNLDKKEPLSQEPVKKIRDSVKDSNYIRCTGLDDYVSALNDSTFSNEALKDATLKALEYILVKELTLGHAVHMTSLKFNVTKGSVIRSVNGILPEGYFSRMGSEA